LSRHHTRASAYAAGSTVYRVSIGQHGRPMHIWQQHRLVKPPGLNIAQVGLRAYTKRGELSTMVNRLIGIVTFKAPVYREVAHDPAALTPASVIVVISTVLIALLSGLLGTNPLGLAAIAASSVVTVLISWLLASALTAFIANKFFGGQEQHGRAVAHLRPYVCLPGVGRHSFHRHNRCFCPFHHRHCTGDPRVCWIRHTEGCCDRCHLRRNPPRCEPCDRWHDWVNRTWRGAAGRVTSQSIVSMHCR
jgi:hypothetical protein